MEVAKLLTVSELQTAGQYVRYVDGVPSMVGEIFQENGGFRWKSNLTGQSSFPLSHLFRYFGPLPSPRI